MQGPRHRTILRNVDYIACRLFKYFKRKSHGTLIFFSFFGSRAPLLWCVKRIQERRTATGRAAGRPFVFSQKIRTWIEEMGVTSELFRRYSQ